MVAGWDFVRSAGGVLLVDSQDDVLDTVVYERARVSFLSLSQSYAQSLQL